MSLSSKDQIDKWEFVRTDVIRDIASLQGIGVDSWKFYIGPKVGYLAYIRTGSRYWVIKSCKPDYVMTHAVEIRKQIKDILHKLR
jgi:hypothetical protein